MWFFSVLTIVIIFYIIHIQVMKMLKSKLKDNKGWGLVEMLVLSGILLLALLFAAYMIYKLYSSF